MSGPLTGGLYLMTVRTGPLALERGECDAQSEWGGSVSGAPEHPPDCLRDVDRLPLR
jgi:hypothetical protein